MLNIYQLADFDVREIKIIIIFHSSYEAGHQPKVISLERKRKNIFCCLWLWLWITIVQLVDDAGLSLFWYENVKDVSIFVIDDIAIFAATKPIGRLPFFSLQLRKYN